MNRRALITRILPAALIAAAGCTTTLNMEEANKAINEGLTKQLGLAMASVTCPIDSRPMKAGDTFECTGTPKDGGRITVKVTQKDDQGNISWEVMKSEGLFDMKLVEGAVQNGLKDKTGSDATVSCGARWRAGKAGDTFECEAKAADGRTGTAVVTVKDADGSISWAMK